MLSRVECCDRWTCDLFVIMWSTFAKYRKGNWWVDFLRVIIFIWNCDAGSQDKTELLNNKLTKNQDGGHKVRFDSLGEDDKIGRRLRGRNIFHHSDVEVASSVAAASVVSDNTHLYRRSRSAVSVDILNLFKIFLNCSKKFGLLWPTCSVYLYNNFLMCELWS